MIQKYISILRAQNLNISMDIDQPPSGKVMDKEFIGTGRPALARGDEHERTRESSAKKIH